jgi:hypothetical protein
LAVSVTDCPLSIISFGVVGFPATSAELTVTTAAIELTVTGRFAESVTPTQYEFVVVGDIVNEFVVEERPEKVASTFELSCEQLLLDAPE